jgi:hypothetical protein
MYSDIAPSTLVPDRRPAAGGELRLGDLNRAERLVICAIRAVGRWQFDPAFLREAALT